MIGISLKKYDWNFAKKKYDWNDDSEMYNVSQII
jgi:hypothetical protein